MRPLPAQQADTTLAATCPHGRVGTITIDNNSIFDTSEPDLDRRLARVYRMANALHVRTRKSVIRRELLLRPGECFDPALLEESERLLRGYDFISRVEASSEPQPDGTVDVVIETRDEWSTQLDVRVRLKDGFQLEGIDLREKNVLGTGQTLGVFYVERDVRRDYGISFQTPQLARTRWDFHGAVGRTRAGTLVRQTVAYPFVGEVSRWAARQSFAREDLFFDYVVSANDTTTRVLLPLRAKSFDVGLVRRFGDRGNLTLLGGALGFQSIDYPGDPQLTRGNRFEGGEPLDSAFAAAVASQSERINNIRLFLLLGQRNVTWVRRRGLDSPYGVHDVPLGSDIELALGRNLSAIERRDDDLFTTFTLYSGFEIERWLTVARVRVDARRDFEAEADESEWEDAIGEAELLGYWRPSRRQTVFLRLAAAGGWETRTPFQLTLGGDRALRGYEREAFPGGRRVLATLEQRVDFHWPAPEVLDVGGTVFVDAGSIWPGDVPFGTDSGWRASAGLGLRGSFPAGGRTAYRLEYAVPIEGKTDLGGGRLLFTIGEMHGVSRVFGDPQVGRSRMIAPTGDLFGRTR